MIHTARQSGKFIQFKRLLRDVYPDLPVDTETLAVGILERLWHLAIVSSPQGDIGKLDDEVIAEAIGWIDDSKQIVGILVECKWLDISSKYRLVIHDWEDHAPAFIKRNITKMGGFLSGDLDTQNSTQVPTKRPRDTLSDDLDTLSGDLDTQNSTQVPTLNLTKPNLTKPNLTKPSKKEDFDFKDKSLNDAVTDWLRYKTERKESYKPTGLKSFLTQVANKQKKYGSEKLASSFQFCMSSGYKGWHYGLEGTSNGQPPKPAAPTPNLVLGNPSEEDQARSRAEWEAGKREREARRKQRMKNKAQQQADQTQGETP